MKRSALLRPTKSVAPLDGSWDLREENLPESVLHAAIITALFDMIATWLVRTHTRGQVVRNLALRWVEERPQLGLDPDVMLLDGPLPRGKRTKSVRTWRDGDPHPRLAIEVVIETAPKKDYVDAPRKYDASGVNELWVFDPLRIGRIEGRTAVALQMWRRAADGSFPRVYAAKGPAWSEELHAWAIVATDGDGDESLRIADNEAGTQRWLTAAEAGEAEIARLRALLAAKE